MRVLAIDPGFGGTGWALFDSNSGVCPLPLRAGIITASEIGQSGDLEDRMIRLSDRLRRIVFTFNRKPTVIAIELPKYMQSPTGHASASSGNLTTLFMAVASCVAVQWQEEIKLKLVPVNDWKGTMPKDLVKKRICKKLSCSKSAYSSHEWDAIGIGLYCLGLF